MSRLDEQQRFTIMELATDWHRLVSSFIHFVSAFVAVIFSQLIALSSASWRLNKPPSSLVIGHESTICSMVC